MTSVYQTPAFLKGRILLDRNMVQSWLNMIDRLIPNATDELLTQLTSCKTNLTNLLSAAIDPTIAVGTIVVPITLVIEIQNTLAVYEYQFSGFPTDPNPYVNMNNEIDSVYIQYSSAYYNGNYSTKIVVY